MQDIKRNHTASDCVACRPNLIQLERARSARRVQRRIDEIIGQRENCLHLRTRTFIEPDVMDDNGDFVGGEHFKVCTDCLRTVEVAR